MKRLILPLSATAGALALPFVQPAAAQTVAAPRPWCAARPGLGTTPCTIAPGRVSAEMAIADLERDRTDGMRTSSLLVGDIGVRVGVTDHVELIAEWTPFGVSWARPDGARSSRSQGTGDVTLATKVNVANPDGAGLSVAVLPFVALPTGDRAFGAGDWATGVVLPVSYALSDRIGLQLTTEFDLATDGDGRGRHPAYSVIGGVGVAIARALSATLELGAGRDHDPETNTAQTFAGLSLACLPMPDLQLDAGGTIGLNSTAPDARVYLGVAHLF